MLQLCIVESSDSSGKSSPSVDTSDVREARSRDGVLRIQLENAVVSLNCHSLLRNHAHCSMRHSCTNG
jgi:hypothetical protein